MMHVKGCDIAELEAARTLSLAGDGERARRQLLLLASQYPDDAAIQYATGCAHDTLGLEHEAVRFYLAAIANGIAGEQLRQCYRALGSAYRVLGQYEHSAQTLREGLRRFPDAPELRVFLAMTLYHLGQPRDTVSSCYISPGAATLRPAN